MIDYRDFQQQAELDIQRAKELYQKNDYGFAAFSAQQGMEKYLKAYLLKRNLISEPKNLGHLQYDVVIKMLIDQFLLMKEDAANDVPIFGAFFDILLKSFDGYKNLIESMKTSNDKKITAWKSSLKIKLNQHEENISKGLDKELASVTSQAKVGVSKLMEILTSIPTDVMNSLSEQDKKLFSLFLSMPQLIDSDNPMKMIEEIMILIKPKLYGNSPNSMPKKDTDMIMRYFLLLWSLKWIDIVMDSYSHQEISRYPTEIDGLNSVDLYQKNKDALLELIQRISNACEEIKSELNRW